MSARISDQAPPQLREPPSPRPQRQETTQGNFSSALIAAAADRDAPIAFQNASLLGAGHANSSVELACPVLPPQAGPREVDPSTDEGRHPASQPVAPSAGAFERAPNARPEEINSTAALIAPASRRLTPARVALPHIQAEHFALNTRPAVKAASAPQVAAPRAALLLALNDIVGRANAVLVAVHATDGELQVFARIGRMNGADRDRLRQDVAQLLSEHGYANAKIELATETHHG